jgi:ketosteroid isomerase-like protein
MTERADQIKTEQLAISEALRELAETVKTAYATNDADLYVSAFATDAIVSMPSARPIRGHAALKAAFEHRPGLPPGATFEVRPLEVEVLCSEWAYAFGTDTLTFADGRTETMTFLVLIRRTAEGWKTFREVVSADQPQGT